MDLTDIIIFLIIFISVLWLQNNDDKKFNKNKRTSIYDKIKIPLFVTCCIFLIKNFNQCVIDVKTFFIVPPENTQSFVKDDIFNDIFTEPYDF
jgi:hypothetical protein